MKEPLVTRAQLAAAAQEEGIPLKTSRIDKEAMKGNGPDPAAMFGKQFLYKKETGLEWARRLLTRLP